MAVPNFSDVAKAANDLLNKDFYHLSAGTLEVKSNTPNNVAFKVTGKNTHEKTTTGTIEGKYTDKALARDPMARLAELSRCCLWFRPLLLLLLLLLPTLLLPLLPPLPHPLLVLCAVPSPHNRRISTSSFTGSAAGLTVTQTWNTANALESKLELADSLAKGLKAEGIFAFLPATQARGAKFNLTFKQSSFHGRAFFDLLRGPTANVDAVIGHDGFLAGASAGYDVNKAAITSYSAAVGYQAPTYSAAVTAGDNLSIFAASYHHKVNSQVEAAAKATWNSKSGNAVGLEVATKYRLDPLSFVKAKINDRGVAAVAYNVLLREGVSFGLGASFDTQKLDQATHKVGTSFTFES
ncbi:outer mitochondrial membrane protein porin [Niveomyces insectorum RCEF 264]|uniref:Outer mitochondrial membrane protein porin n=1 Tax=Niveomyces insectorum RCEF 264 TaxID=1081102 RepID=A0A162MTC2_9HYPO|nr:outer mitochondrial membrane protein porin [Niveomyces insectorum RCEF 264]